MYFLVGSLYCFAYRFTIRTVSLGSLKYFHIVVRMTKKLLEGKEISLVTGFSQGIVVARRNIGVTTCSALNVDRNAMASHTVLTDRTREAADV